MTRRNLEGHKTAFTISVDAAQGITTGISAADRARTIRLLADPSPGPTHSSDPATFSRSRHARMACCAAPATPRPPSTSPASPDCPKPP
jgi:3,4-dihydroxy-2-butanone 4-phosphate synthase